MNRILLVDVRKLPSLGLFGERYSYFNHPPVGLAYLSAAARQRFPHLQIQIFHTLLSKTPVEDVMSAIDTLSPDLIGLRALAMDKDSFKCLARRIRKHAPTIPLIGGGPYPTFSYDILLQEGLVDLVVRGEGEVTFVDLIDRMINEAGVVPRDLLGTAVSEGGRVRLNPPRPLIDNLDSIPFPDIELLNLPAYKGFSNLGFQDSSDTALLLSSRGCPHRCIYCHPMFGKRERHRSPENLVAEMQLYIDRYGMNNFLFLDDTFNTPDGRAKACLRRIIRDLPTVHLSFCGIRVDNLDEELVDLLEEAGTRLVEMSVETASPRLQKVIGKYIDVEKARSTIQVISKRFPVQAFFMIGFPTETYEEAMQTIEFAVELDHVVNPVCSPLRIYRHSELYRMLDPTPEQARRIEDQEKCFVQDKLSDDPHFYGDLFAPEKVPLRGTDIVRLRWEWMRRVVMNSHRIRNSHRVLSRHFEPRQVVQFYRNFYTNPDLDQHGLDDFLHRMGVKIQDSSTTKTMCESLSND